MVHTPEGRILSWNGSAERLFGYSPAEAIGEPTPPTAAAKIFQQMMAKLLAGERVLHFEAAGIGKHGIDVSLALSPLREDAGEVTAVAVIARDITARKQARSPGRSGFHRGLC